MIADVFREVYLRTLGIHYDADAPVDLTNLVGQSVKIADSGKRYRQCLRQTHSGSHADAYSSKRPRANSCYNQS
jgi:hypothetical protein